MPISTTPPAKNKGFSLLEILIALAIGALVLGLAVGLGLEFSSRKDLEATMEKIERAVLFAVDEAALRNSIVRLRFLLDRSPQEFVLEFSPVSNFVLPKGIQKLDNAGELGEEEGKKQKEMLAKINKKFSRIKEFQDSNEILPRNVHVIGIGTASLEKIIFGPEASIFIYPDGEKDGAIVILGTDEEMASLSVEEFGFNFARKFIKNPPLPPEPDREEGALLDEQFEKAKEIFAQWIGN